jgi:hypothetical protein
MSHVVFQSISSSAARVFSRKYITPDHRSDLGTSKRHADPAPPRTVNQLDIHTVFIVIVAAVVIGLLAFTFHSYSPIAPAGPKISTSEPITTGEADAVPSRSKSGHQRSIERYPALRARERPGSLRTP